MMAPVTARQPKLCVWRVPVLCARGSGWWQPHVYTMIQILEKERDGGLDESDANEGTCFREIAAMCAHDTRSSKAHRKGEVRMM